MRLVGNWREVLAQAWSVRLMALAAVFSGLEIAVPLLDGVLPVSKGAFALLSFATLAAAFVTRLLAQRGLSLPEEAPL